MRMRMRMRSSRRRLGQDATVLSGFGGSADGSDSYLTESVYNVVLQKSTPARIRQLILYYC